MQVHTFIAHSAADAITQIRETLGPDAVVLNVRRPPGEGLARLWQKPRIEVLAHVPEKPEPPLQAGVLAELREELAEIRQKVQGQELDRAATAFQPESLASNRMTPSVQPVAGHASIQPGGADLMASASNGGWRVGALLMNSGLLPLHAQWVVEQLRERYGDTPPASLGEEFALAQSLLSSRWQPLTHPTPGAHVFIGPPGAGKTTCLSKWLAHVALVESRPAAVWRLDGHVANTAESLSVFCEILGVPLERFQPDRPAPADGSLFIDLPGVNPTDAAAMASLRAQIDRLPNPQVHLVLNAAYETSLLLAQVRAFSVLPVADLLVTHLDEESRWGKIWNLVLGTNYTPRFLCAGQNIPGEFIEATPEVILARQFLRK
ncbi:MAG: hypothetical protein IH623_00760 [Verrucomicrobia bacterium]|nr:hypothetical protein [Verrucomicrobiota bacterium]